MCRKHAHRDVIHLAMFAMLALLACSAPRAPISRGVETGGQTPRIAIAPVTLSPELERRRAGAPDAFEDATTHAGHYFAEALLEHGFEVMTAEDSDNLMGLFARSSEFHHDASRLARLAVERLGVDGILVVEVTEWTPRAETGVDRTPAEIGFRATLHGGPSGGLLWSGRFSDRQRSFFDSPWHAVRYPGGGTRWLSEHELARWGARRLVAEIPVLPPAPQKAPAASTH